MSGRRANTNRIRGPQSALTDFLAANNISAAEIRDSYEQRTRQARLQNESVVAEGANVEDDDDEEGADDIEEEHVQQRSASKKRKRMDEKTKAKLKAKKKSNKAKGYDDDDDDSDFEDDDDEAALGRDIYKKAKRMPGQLEHCEVCGKRFTVTPYSKTGGDGGLLCTPCGKQMAKEQKSAERKAKRPAQGKARRKIESKRLEGNVSLGAKSLQDLCIEKAADVHNDIEEFGDLPDNLLDRLSEIFSKRRVMDSRTFQLFLRPDLDTVAVHDAAKLEEDDFKQIFAVTPKIKRLVLRNAGQFKDSVLEYMMDKAQHIEFFQVYGSNLITNDMWKTFFEEYGHRLRALKLQWLDASFDDEAAATMIEHCSNLERLKFKFCTRLTENMFNLLPQLHKLEHVSLRMSQPIGEDILEHLIAAIGPRLKTLSLENLQDAQDSVLDNIHAQCSHLTKLRIGDVECMSDVAFAKLFNTTNDEEKTVVPPLSFVDISARDIDNNNPDGTDDNQIGFASSGFKSLMAHSGTTLKRLEIASCRHISHAAFADVFNGDTTYPELCEINVSFCNTVDTGVIRGIFACCPKLRKVTAFGCFKIEDVIVPTGIALIGVPRAQDAIEQHGNAGVDLFSALDMMNQMIGVAA